MSAFLHFRRRKKTPEPLEDGVDLSGSESVDPVRPRNFDLAWPKHFTAGLGPRDEEYARSRPRTSRGDIAPAERSSGEGRWSERRLLDSARSHPHPSPPSSDWSPSPRSSVATTATITITNTNTNSNTQHDDEPIMPVFDGFPGSTGYDDVRPIESSTPSVYPHNARLAIPHPHLHVQSSATSSWDPSPTSSLGTRASSASQLGPFVSPTERTSDMDALAAARLRSPPLVESYGPNPVTPNPKLRPYARAMSCEDRDSIHGSATYTTAYLPIPPPPEPLPPLPFPSSSSCPALPQQHFPAQHQYKQPHEQQQHANAQVPLQSYAPAMSSSVSSQSCSNFLRKPPSTPLLITSYGPNRVTPTPPLRPSISPLDLGGPGAVTPASSTSLRDAPQFQPALHLLYSAPFSLPPPAAQHYVPTSPLQQPYQLFDPPISPAGGEQDSWIRSLGGPDVGDTPVANGNGPLPPYASTDDFKAMEKGAIRQLAPPQAQAELPPTKDGFYHYAANVIEYELPAAARTRQSSLPSNPYARQAAMHQKQQQRQHGPTNGRSGNDRASGGASSSANGGVSETGGLNLGGGGAAPGARFRAIDEQKFLLSDLLADPEIARLLAKAKARRAQAAGDEGPVLLSPVDPKPTRSFLDDKFDLDGMPRMENLRV